MTTDNFCFYLQNCLIQTSQIGGQWYNDTSPFSIPWFMPSDVSINNVIKLCFFVSEQSDIAGTGNTKGGSITVLLTSCLTGLESAV